ncbi:NrfD/PsrC family molybdoenzyme membrane anchor subunit [Micromonospora sp. DT15]|uniref:NrfD/PsrC family molybdoenzyme membrane anchor subunit n=1 Tax=Micromonospora sp. DT15 TaxID=3393445 RepID=UPI003CF7D8DD
MTPSGPVGDRFRRFRERLADEGGHRPQASHERPGSATGAEHARGAEPPASAGDHPGGRAITTDRDSTSGDEVGSGRRGHQSVRRSGEPPGRRRRRRGGGAEELRVPEAEFTSYYGRPILKGPVWKWDIAAYLFTGGLAAGSSLLAAGGQLTGRPVLRRAGRVTALAAVSASAVFLVKDLGRPARFHHMLRVAKPTSPMSMGTWILTAYGPAAGIAAIAEAAGVLPRRGLLGLAGRALPSIGHAAGLLAAGTAPALATYTGVLLADTAVPSWHEAYPELPVIFAGSALASGAGVGLLAAPPAEAGPARRMAVAGAAMELYGAHRVETRLGLLSEPYRLGRPGRLLRAGRLLTAGGVAGALLGRRSRVVGALSGTALLAASVLTRFGIFYGGVASARDPRYTVVPQRERVEARRTAMDVPSDWAEPPAV